MGLKKRNVSIFKQYVFSYMVMVLIPVMIVGFLFIAQYSERIRKRMESELSSQLAVLCNDMEETLSLLSGESNWLTTQDVFSNFVYHPTAYNTMLVNESMRLMMGHVPMDIEISCYRKNANVIYTNGAVATLNTYMSKYGNQNNAALPDYALSQTTPGFVRWIGTGSQPYLLFIYPCNMMIRSSAFKDVTLIYSIDQDAVWKRCKQLIGTIPGELALFYEDQLLFGQWEHPKQSADTKYVSTKDGAAFFDDINRTPLHIALWVEESQFANEIALVYHACLLTMSIISMMGIALSIVFAKRSFKPIQILKEKASQMDDGSINAIGNEIDYIGGVISNSQQIQNSLKNVLQEQRDALMQQVLELLIRGDTGLAVREMMTRSGLLFPYSLLSVAVVRTKEGVERHGETLDSMIEQLVRSKQSADQYEWYPFASSLVAHGVVIILSLKNQEVYEDAQKNIARCLSSSIGDFVIGCGSIYDELDQLHISFSEAVYATETTNSASYDEDYALNVFSAWYSNEKIHLAQIIKAGNIQKTETTVRQVIGHMREDCRSAIMSRLLCLDLLSSIVKVALSDGIKIDDQKLNRCMRYRNLTEYEDHTIDLAGDISRLFSERIVAQSMETTQQMLEYISEHATEYDISLQRLSAHFDLSFNQINSILKESTGHTFRDVVIAYRLEYAQRLLLTSDMSVAQISAAVGYNNVSHFIKQFKTTYNLTPSKFRDQQEENTL